MRGLAFVILWLFLASSAYGQAVGVDKWASSLPTSGERKAADIASWITVAASVALDAKASWDAENRPKAFALQGVRLGVTAGAAFAVKSIVHRDRPCEPDCGRDNARKSFYSAHASIGCSTMGGGRLVFSLPLAFETGWLRIAADKHWLTDVLAGCGAGLLTSRIR